MRSKGQPIRKPTPAQQGGRKKKSPPAEERFAGLDLSYYREIIEPDQLDLLLEFVDAHPVKPGFDPSELYHPER